jgi:hypothetical protein
MNANRRPRVCDALLIVAALAALWSLGLWLSGGVSWSVGPLHVSSRNVTRPLALAAVAAAAFTWLRGWRDVSGARAEWRVRGCVVSLAAMVIIVGASYRTGVASGSDSYGYLSQAELWRAGSLRIEQPVVREFPWASATWSFAPLGYAPTPADNGDIVPVYSPGLPMLMAAAKAIGGQAAMFWIAPVFGAVLVIATFGIGARVATRSVGVAAALLVALSPVVLYMTLWPMTDLPNAACWALATWAALGTTRGRMLAAGALAALAIFIRPNLFLIGALMGLWILARDLSERRDRPVWTRIDRAVCFGLAILPGIFAVMAFNYALQGSPLRSGYGTIAEVLVADQLDDNVRNYTWSLVRSQSPLVFLGFIPLVLPIAGVWLTKDRSRDALLLACVTLGTLVSYAFYAPYDAWWYLRFLLPMWPALFIGFAWLVYRGARGRAGLWIAASVIIVAGYGLWFLSTEHIGAIEGDEHRYVTSAQLVSEMTPANSVIITWQHSGSVRYYGERMTLRWDTLPPESLEQAIRWFDARGAHPFILLEGWELPLFRERFSAAGALGALDMRTVFELRDPGHVLLFDPLRPASPDWPEIRRPYDRSAGERSVPPAAAPILRLMLPAL